MQASNDKDSAKWKIIFVLGSPGGGKNTQCDKIEEKYQIFHFSCGDLLRAAIKEKNEEAELINSYIKDGKIVPARITCSLQKKCMEKNGKDYDVYLCDGFPRNEENFNFFLEVFGKECQIIGVLYLECPEQVCIDRILKRGGQRVDDNIESIKKRFTVMAKETEPNLENLKKYAPVHRIKADQTIEKCFQDIDAILKPLLKERTTPLKK